MAFQIPRHPEAFSLDPGRKAQGGQIKSPKHLAFIRKLPCLATGLQGRRIDAAHVRYADPAYNKPWTGKGTKPDDCWTVPLDHNTHLYGQHANNERQWWLDLGIDPLSVAQQLYAVSGDIEAGYRIIVDARGRLPPWRPR